MKSRITPAQIASIRQEYDLGRLNAAAWAQLLRCHVETVRRVARRESHNQTAAAAFEPSESEVAASLRKLQQTAAETPAAGAAGVLEEFLNQGKES
jgi:hypothetical protein